MATDPSGLILVELSGTWEHKALQWYWRVEMEACGDALGGPPPPGRRERFQGWCDDEEGGQGVPREYPRVWPPSTLLGSNGGVGPAPKVDGPTAPPVKKHGCFVGI